MKQADSQTTEQTSGQDYVYTLLIGNKKKMHVKTTRSIKKQEVKLNERKSTFKLKQVNKIWNLLESKWLMRDFIYFLFTLGVYDDLQFYRI